jgi:type III secretory pathway component EscT
VAVCAITAVLAAEGKRIDLFGVMVLALVKAVGGLFLANGGTVSIVNPVGTSLEVTPLQAAPPSDLPVN